MGDRTEIGYWVLPEVLALVDQAHAEGFEKGYKARGEELAATPTQPAPVVRWWEVLMYLSCALAFLACAAFWLFWLLL